MEAKSALWNPHCWSQLNGTREVGGQILVPRKLALKFGKWFNSACDQDYNVNENRTVKQPYSACV